MEVFPNQNGGRTKIAFSLPGDDLLLLLLC